MPEEYILKLPAILILTFMLFSLIVLMLLNTVGEDYSADTAEYIPAPETGDEKYVGFSDFRRSDSCITKRKRTHREIPRDVEHGYI